MGGATYGQKLREPLNEPQKDVGEQSQILQESRSPGTKPYAGTPPRILRT